MQSQKERARIESERGSYQRQVGPGSNTEVASGKMDTLDLRICSKVNGNIVL